MCRVSFLRVDADDLLKLPTFPRKHGYKPVGIVVFKTSTLVKPTFQKDGLNVDRKLMVL